MRLHTAVLKVEYQRTLQLCRVRRQCWSCVLAILVTSIRAVQRSAPRITNRAESAKLAVGPVVGPPWCVDQLRPVQERGRERTQPSMGECHVDPLRVAAYSTCPSGLWHSRIAPLLAAPDMVMLNIGANKGYNLIEFLQRYSAIPSNLTHAAWYRSLMQHGCQTQCCGVCASCRMQRIAQQANAKVSLHAFELQPSNVRMLRQLVAAASLPVTVHSTAVSNTTGEVLTAPDVRPGAESFGIVRASHRRAGVKRPVTTVDAFMTAHGVQHAHFVSIDTEGATLV